MHVFNRLLLVLLLLVLMAAGVISVIYGLNTAVLETLLPDGGFGLTDTYLTVARQLTLIEQGDPSWEAIVVLLAVCLLSLALLALELWPSKSQYILLISSGYVSLHAVKQELDRVLEQDVAVVKHKASVSAARKGGVNLKLLVQVRGLDQLQAQDRLRRRIAQHMQRLQVAVGRTELKVATGRESKRRR